MPGEEDDGGDFIMLMVTVLRPEWMRRKVVTMGGRVHCSKEGMIAGALSSFVEDGGRHGGRVHCSKEGMIAGALSSFVEDGTLTTMVALKCGESGRERRRERTSITGNHKHKNRTNNPDDLNTRIIQINNQLFFIEYGGSFIEHVHEKKGKNKNNNPENLVWNMGSP